MRVTGDQESLEEIAQLIAEAEQAKYHLRGKGYGFTGLSLLKTVQDLVPEANRISACLRFEFELGQLVYLKTDNEQSARMVTAISLRPNQSVLYCLSLGSTESWHYGIEIDAQRDVVKATS